MIHRAPTNKYLQLTINLLDKTIKVNQVRRAEKSQIQIAKNHIKYIENIPNKNKMTVI
jgi:hypothetical protein